MDQSRDILHLGPGEKSIEGARTFDLPEFDLEYDIFPFTDNSVGGIVATHVLEHLADPRHIIREAARILAPGCPLMILVPHADSLMAKQDLDHKSQFAIDTWRVLLSNPYYNLNNNDIPFRIGANFLFGFSERNLALVTQLIKI
jgi:SAM-dependent methyltransferase